MVSSPAKSVIFFQLIIFLAQNEDSLSLKSCLSLKKKSIESFWNNYNRCHSSWKYN